jgi:hypothetical protein
MALPSEGSVQSSFRVKWEKFTASKSKNRKKLRVVRKMHSGSTSCLLLWTLGGTEALHLHALKTLAEPCTHMTQTEVDRALLPIPVAATLLRKTDDSLPIRQHTVLPEREHAQNIKPVFHLHRLIVKPIYYAIITANFVQIITLVRIF